MQLYHTFISYSRADGEFALKLANYEGKQVHYADIDAGGTMTQPTYDSHIWLVANENGDCIGLYKAPGKIVIE